MKKTIVYKLVSVGHGQLRSYNTQDGWGEMPAKTSLIYKPGETTFPLVAGTPLFAFRTKEAAIKWNLGWISNQLWSAEATCVRNFSFSVRAEKFEKFCLYIPTQGWEKFMQNWRRKIRTRQPATLEGMVLCSSIKLLKQLKP